ncbi:DUF2309 domain-containing protein [Microbacterium sp. CCNWLW134]|uniref:DUF2309 domain-containing protein n=1 Tax=Microbacterium sp. CCNWLW134 TaxID=3122064 RepID=UPI0030100277
MTLPSLHDSVLEQRAAIRGMVAAAARAISPHYPLETFIARNPVADYERLSFEDAIRAVAADHGAGLTHPEPVFRQLLAAGRITPDDLRRAIAFHVAEARSPRILCCGETEVTVGELLLIDLCHAPADASPRPALQTPAALRAPKAHARIDEHIGRWLSAAFAEASWARGPEDGGLWEAWRRLAPLDLRLPRRVRSGIRWSATHPEDAIADVLSRWEWDDATATQYLRAHVLAQPGWTAAVRHAAMTGDERMSVTALVAMRVTLESLLLADRDLSPEELGYVGAAQAPAAPGDDRIDAVGRAAGVDVTDPAVRQALARVLSLVDPASRRAIWQEAYERGVARRLAPVVAPVLRPVGPATGRPLAQAVFCIDPRSEGIRRHLEAAGHVETLGFAGFFAVPISFRSAAGGPAVASCPVLLTPRRAVTESSSDREPLARWQERLAGGHALRGTFGRVKESTITPFALAETAGWLMGPAMAARTVSPTGWRALAERVGRLLPAKPATRLDADVAMDLDERVLYAEAALRMMGLVDGFARLVVLAGHGAEVTNNPYASALQCGACGGHEGAPNARAAALVFNDPPTRARLAERGIRIPDDTLFVAAQHDTVTDSVRLLEPWAIPATHADDVERLDAVVGRARAGHAAERLALLPGVAPGADPLRETARRGADWAEVYPEWGLAGNAAFIVGPRSITAGHDLGRRAFLHSYDADADPDGSGLETILTAPMIVAQWINAQYAASALSPDRFGAGPKPLHNVVGTVGVLSGYGGDLRIGLPWQSVGVGGELVHEPVRLQVFVQAPFARLNHLLESAEVVRDLVVKEWITLRAREHDTDRWLRFGPYGWVEEPDLAPVPADTPAPTLENLEASR